MNRLALIACLAACSSPAPRAESPAPRPLAAPADAGVAGDAAPEIREGSADAMTATSEPGSMRVRFRARVEAVTVLSDFSGTAKPVHFDPRFALVVHVLEVEPEGAGIAAGADDVFLIHSPAKLFRGGGIDASVGGEYDFSVEREQRGAGVRWTGLRLE